MEEAKLVKCLVKNVKFSEAADEEEIEQVFKKAVSDCLKEINSDKYFLNWLALEHNDIYIKYRGEWSKKGKPIVE